MQTQENCALIYPGRRSAQSYPMSTGEMVMGSGMDGTWVPPYPKKELFNFIA